MLLEHCVQSSEFDITMDWEAAENESVPRSTPLSSTSFLKPSGESLYGLVR